VEYGDNVASGKGKGSFTIILKQNGAGSYSFGGKKKFTFTISDVEGIVL
jgi:hypothetical protein